MGKAKSSTPKGRKKTTGTKKPGTKKPTAPKQTKEEKKLGKMGKHLKDGPAPAKPSTKPGKNNPLDIPAVVETESATRSIIDTSPMNAHAAHMIFVVRPGQSSKSVEEIAGYLGCKNVADLFDLIAAVHDPVRRLMDHKGVSTLKPLEIYRSVNLNRAVVRLVAQGDEFTSR